LGHCRRLSYCHNLGKSGVEAQFGWPAVPGLDAYSFPFRGEARRRIPLELGSKISARS
jgi:hypothetical protein